MSCNQGHVTRALQGYKSHHGHCCFCPQVASYLWQVLASTYADKRLSPTPMAVSIIQGSERLRDSSQVTQHTKITEPTSPLLLHSLGREMSSKHISH